MIAAIATSRVQWSACTMTKRMFGLAFLILTLITAFQAWRDGDWALYVNQDHVGLEPRPKVDLPLWFQIATSLLMGAVVSGVVVGVAAVVFFGIRRLRKAGRPPASQR